MHDAKCVSLTLRITNHVFFMDIFKLFFNHDQRLDKLAKRNANKTKDEVEATLEDFMKPTPTYSKFYLTGTRLEEEQFGINILTNFGEILDALEEVFSDHVFTLNTTTESTLTKALREAQIGDAILISSDTEAEPIDTTTLKVDSESNVGHFKEELKEALEKDYLVMYKEQAHDGFDLHVFSKENIYPKLFHALKPIVNSDFRFFSINSKRMRTEKHFYFETWMLDKPPHGAEEVLPETVL